MHTQAAYTPQAGMVTINKSQFIETMPYHQMVSRPFETNLRDNNVTNAFNEATDGGRTITPESVSGFAGEFLNVTAAPTGDVLIDNGWNTPRFRFILDLTILADGVMGGYGVRKIVQGYTDHTDISFGGKVDPKMRIYFNNIMTLRESVVETPYGTNIRTSICESNQILRGESEPGEVKDASVTMRPVDVYTSLGSKDLGYNDNEVFDLRNSFMSEPIKKSKRNNALPSRYVADVLNAYKLTQTGVVDDIFGNNETNVYDETRAHVLEDSVAIDQFFALLSQQCPDFQYSGYTTYETLCRIIPDFDLKTVMITKGAVQQIQHTQDLTNIGMNSEHWSGSNLETVWASTFASSIPALMLNLMLTKVDFQATNQTIDGKISVGILHTESFVSGLDLGPYLDRFINDLIAEVLVPLTKGNQIDFDLLCQVDTAGDTRFKISIGGGYHVDYINPSYCDGLIAPTNGNFQALDNMAYDTSNLTSMLLSTG